MVLHWSEAAVPGLHVGRALSSTDERGQFFKLWTDEMGPSALRPDEVFFSISGKGSVRGMHVQKGRAAGRRLIFVTRGVARDFVIDLRVGSPTFGSVVETLLKPGELSILVPPGCAHGFESLEEQTTMVYVQEGRYEADLDIGVHWTSCGFAPHSSSPTVSERDNALPHLSEFDSPFTLGVE